ncbi:nucleoside kinase [Syntrophomonas wolfei]|jgi:uridine kinase|uniref:nucleoside kinase n=1 Tax=Syntrophomonas wolfei TaxID=863 RepID=UPI0009E9601E|nr:nucleoside kinase [Syntrophomonas wolfei]
MAIARVETAGVEVRIKGIGSYNVLEGTSVAELLKRLEKKLLYPVMAIIIDNRLRDLNYRFTRSCAIELVDMNSEIGVRIYRRSVSFLLMKAARDLYPERVLTVKHSLSNGLLCEFLNEDSRADEIEALEKRMREMVEDNLPIRRMRINKERAQEIFREQGEEDKVKLLAYRDVDKVQVSELDGFYENFYIFMLPETGMLKKFRLFEYPPGMILQTPELSAPNSLRPYVEQKKLASIFQEAKKWAEMLETPHVAALNDIIEQGDINDIIRVNEALHEKKIAFIADQICSDEDIRLVLISGPSSSGKTTFAQRLLIQLRVNGKKPVVLSLDNYFVDRDLTPRDENNDYDFEALEALKVDLFNEHLGRLIKGDEVEIPIYSFTRGSCEERGMSMKVPAGEPIIIEGIHGLNERLTWSIPPEQKFKIYISALTQLNIDYSNRIPTTDSRLVRRIVRDARTRGYNALDTIKRWPSVRRGEERNIFSFQENADIMFNSSLVYELSVLKPYIEPLLRQIGPEHPEYVVARYLLQFASYFKPIAPDAVPANSILREFIGGSCFKV